MDVRGGAGKVGWWGGGAVTYGIDSTMSTCAWARNVKVRIQDLQVGSLELYHTTRTLTCWASHVGKVSEDCSSSSCCLCAM